MGMYTHVFVNVCLCMCHVSLCVSNVYVYMCLFVCMCVSTCVSVYVCVSESVCVYELSSEDTFRTELTSPGLAAISCLVSLD